MDSRTRNKELKSNKEIIAEKQAEKEKLEKDIAKIQNGTYLDKSSFTLFQIAVDIQDEKLKNRDINENTYGRNLENKSILKKYLEKT